MKGCSNYFNKVIGFSNEEFFNGEMNLSEGNVKKSFFKYVPSKKNLI